MFIYSVYVLFMCKRKIKSVQGLLRNRPYRLMNIASPYKNFYIFKIFLISSIVKKNQNYFLAVQLLYMFFPNAPNAKRELNPLRGYGDTGRTNLCSKLSTHGRLDGRTGLNTIAPAPH